MISLSFSSLRSTRSSGTKKTSKRRSGIKDRLDGGKPEGICSKNNKMEGKKMMKNKYLLILVCAVLFVAIGGEVNAKKPSAAVGGSAVIGCADLLVAFSYPNTSLTSISLVPGGTDERPGITDRMPEHCVVNGKMNERVSPVDGKTYAIGFQMRLPTEWNGRFFYQGNGGTDGSVTAAYGNILGGGPTSNGLLKGFAVISSDAGHNDDRSSPVSGGVFGIDPQARLDYGYNAVGQLTPMAKKLVKTYYGKMPDKSYIVGSSNGGRHTMVAASRFADQYDGYLAGAPGFNLPKAAVAQLWGGTAVCPHLRFVCSRKRTSGNRPSQYLDQFSSSRPRAGVGQHRGEMRHARRS